MNDDYDKVIEFFSEHETAIYGLGPTDDGAEEGTLLWCIKELDSVFDINTYIDKGDKAIKQRILKVICALIDIYENSSNDASYTYYEIWNITSERMPLRPETNADRIRNMTVEELAINVVQGQCACCAYQLTGCTEKECKDGAYEWLMKEVEK